MERLAWFSIVALLLVAGPPALGDESRWKALYDEGRDAQEEGQHAKAIAKFSAALEAGPDPRNRATILKRMAQSEKALDEERKAEIEKGRETAGTTAPPPQPPEQTPIGTVAPTPGPGPKEEPQQAQSPPPRDPPPPLGIAGGVGLGVAGLFVAGGIAAVVVHGQTLAIWNDDSKCLNKNPMLTRGEQCAGERATLDLTQNLAISSFVIGGALAITSIVLIALPQKKVKHAPVSLGGGPGDFGLACVGSF